MKKSILFTLTLSAVFLFISLFSSCVIVTHEYDITLYNDTSYTVGDWYVKDRAGTNYEKSSYYVTVRPRQSSTIRNLKKKEYKVVFAYEDAF